MKAISYALFGAGVKHENSFTFETYLSGLLICLRQNRILFPGWTTVVNTDYPTYMKYEELFLSLPCETVVHDPQPYTKAMLWRLSPVFDTRFTHVGFFTPVLPLLLITVFGVTLTT